MKPQGIFGCFRGGGRGKCQIFSGNDEYFIKYGETLLKERISLFDGRTNPIRCFSVDELDSMNVDNHPVVKEGHYKCYAGVSDGNLVLVKIFCSDYFGESGDLACREIAVAAQMGTHSNVNRLLGFCLSLVDRPVLVYEWAENGTLADRIFKYKEQSKQALEWKDRLRIAWEIAHALSYLHTAFRRPIVHRNLKPSSVFLDQDDSARLSEYSLAISIPEGKKYVEDVVMGTMGCIAPEYMSSGRLTESVDVFYFGGLLLTLLTGKSSFSGSHVPGWDRLVHLVNANRVGDIVDPAITTNRPVDDEKLNWHLKAFIELALRCIAEDEERRPMMVEVAAELKSMVMSSSASL